MATAVETELLATLGALQEHLAAQYEDENRASSILELERRGAEYDEESYRDLADAYSDSEGWRADREDADEEAAREVRRRFPILMGRQREMKLQRWATEPKMLAALAEAKAQVAEVAHYVR